MYIHFSILRFIVLSNRIYWNKRDNDWEGENWVSFFLRLSLSSTIFAMPIGTSRLSQWQWVYRIEALYHFYFLQAKLILGGLSLCQSLKVPFVLLPPLNSDDPDPYPGIMTTGINFNPASIITTTTDTPLKTVSVTSPAPPASQNMPDVSSTATTSNTPNVQGSAGRSPHQQQEGEDGGSIDESRTRPTAALKGLPLPVTTTVAQVVTTQQHQPQIHHHHLVSSPATTPSPVRVPSVEHLFWKKEKSFNDSITYFISSPLQPSSYNAFFHSLK